MSAVEPPKPTRSSAIPEGERSIITDTSGTKVTKVEAKVQGQHHYLLCLDPADSVPSKKALDYAKARLAIAGDTIVLLVVLPLVLMDPTGVALGLSAGLEGEWAVEEEAKQQKKIQERTLARLHTAAKEFGPGVAVHIHLTHGDPTTEIIRAAEYHQSDLVVVGRRKMGRFERWTSSGSVSTALLQHSDVSVLVVRSLHTKVAKLFKKPPHQAKSTTPLRSSDARKLRHGLRLSPQLAALLLPDGTTSTKLLSHLDEPVTIYSSPDGEPLFFKPGKEKDDAELVPTCYTLDRIPGMLPELVTAEQVVEHLISGSALFGAGVSDASLAALPDDLEPGALIAITAEGSPRVVAVGELATSKASLLKDRKGKAVVTLHARGDFLWKMGSEENAVPLELQKHAARDSDALPRPSAPTPPPTSSDPPIDLSPLSVADPLSPEAVSATLRTALLLGLRSAPPSLPLPASSLYASHILPFRPVGEGATAEIKKSGYKKVDKLFKTLAKEGVVVCKDVKGDCIVVSYNPKHPDIEAARAYRTISQATPSATALAVPPKAGPQTAVRDLLKVPDALTSLIFSTPPPSDFITPSALKAALTAYIVSNNLTHARDGKYAVLNTDLVPWVEAKATKGGSDKSAPPASSSKVGFKVGEEVGDVMAKDDILKKMKEKCGVWYGVTVEDREEIVKKGSPPRIKIALKTVGKRMVTLVSGLETWATYLPSLENDAVAEELRHRAASSTAVQQVSGSSPKKPLFEVMVQGSHEVLVTKVLTERGLPKGYIDVDTSKLKR